MKRVAIHVAVIGALLGMGAGAVYLFPRDRSTAAAATNGAAGEGENSGDKQTPQNGVDDPNDISPPGDDDKPSATPANSLTVRGSDGQEGGGAFQPSSRPPAGSGSLYSPTSSASASAGGGYRITSDDATDDPVQDKSSPAQYSLGDDTDDEQDASSATTGVIEKPSTLGANARLVGDAASNPAAVSSRAQDYSNALRSGAEYGQAAAPATAGLADTGLADTNDAAGGAADQSQMQPSALEGRLTSQSAYGDTPSPAAQPPAAYSAPGAASPYAQDSPRQAGQSPAYGNDNATGGYAASSSQAQPYTAGNSYLSSREQQPPQALDTRGVHQSLQAQAAPQALGGSTSLAGSLQGAAAPGAKHLEGPQTPSITIEKSAPIEIQVNQPAVFQITVRNTGDVAAHNVTVVDQVPQGTSLIDATPQPQQSAGGLMWQLGSIEPGDEQVISVQLMPEQEGEIGSVAQVLFQAQSSVRTVCTMPQLEVTQSAPPQVLIGDELTVSITISNTGSGAATGVVLESDIPEQFIHDAGNQLEYEVGTLRPGETRQISLSLAANKAGQAENTIMLRADGNRTKRHTLPLEVVAPQLTVAMDGPRIRYLERQATYTLSVANTGTAPANNVDLVAQLPKGMKFVSTDNQGQYDAQRHAVYWSLEQLPALARGDVQLTAIPVETGEQRILAEARADLGLAVSGEATLQVDGLAALLFTVVDSADPIEIGSETTYEIRVTNTGTKPDTNVQVLAELPPGLSPIGGDGPTQSVIREQQILFEPLPRLAPNSEQIYKVHVKGTSPGIPRIRISVRSDAVIEPVTKEEGTRVYSDQ